MPYYNPPGVPIDPNGNASANNFIPSYTTTATAAGTTVLTVASTEIQRFTGATTQTITLPVVSTLPKTGFGFWIVNDSSGSLTVNSSGGNLVATILAGNRLWVFAILLTGTSAASWDTMPVFATSGITNSAPENTVPKSNASGNLVSSSITDDGNFAVVTVGTAALQADAGVTIAANMGQVAITGGDSLTGIAIGGSTAQINISGSTDRTVSIGGSGATITLDSLNDIVTFAATIINIGSLPDADPSVPGQLYRTGGAVMISL